MQIIYSITPYYQSLYTNRIIKTCDVSTIKNLKSCSKKIINIFKDDLNADYQNYVEGDNSLRDEDEFYAWQHRYSKLNQPLTCRLKRNNAVFDSKGDVNTLTCTYTATIYDYSIGIPLLDYELIELYEFPQQPKPYRILRDDKEFLSIHNEIAKLSDKEFLDLYNKYAYNMKLPSINVKWDIGQTFYNDLRNIERLELANLSHHYSSDDNYFSILPDDTLCSYNTLSEPCCPINQDALAAYLFSNNIKISKTA